MTEKIISYFEHDDNVVSVKEKKGTVFVTVKDSGLIDTEKIEEFPDVESVVLSRNRIIITTKEKTMAANYNEISSKIVDLVGGKDNISYFTHCVTRLRFNLKDEKKVNKEEIDKLKGVLGSQWQNGQLQVIIGQAVGDVYKEICEANGLTVEKAIDENVDEVPAKKGIKGVIDKIFDGVSGSLTPFIPALIGSGMIKVILIFADMLGADATSGTYQLLSFAGDAGFYFLPIIIGAFAAKKFGANQGLGMVIGGMLVYPSFAASSGLNFLGIPVYSNSYSSTIIPIILSCAVMAPIERFFAKHSPEILRSVLEPLCTILDRKSVV